MTDPTQEIDPTELTAEHHEEIVATDEPSEIDLLTEERDQAKDLYLRTLAEFQNFRKRAHQEKADLQKMATQDLARDLLSVLDNFERTLAAAEAGATLDALVEGVKAVDRQLRATLTQRHVTRIESIGKPFDPEIHEPIGTDVTAEVPEDTVTVEVEPGYRMGDKILRPARVRVAKKP